MLQASVGNSGDSLAEGTIVVSIEEFPKLQSARRVVLQPGQHEQLDVFVQIPETVQDLESVHITATMVVRYGEREVILERNGTPARHTMTLGVGAGRTLGLAMQPDPPEVPAWYWPQALPLTDYEFAIAARLAAGHHRMAATFDERQLPLNDSSWAGLDLFVIADPSVLEDGAVVEAMRRYVASGGRLWIMLDLVPCSLVRPLLGPNQLCEEIERVELNDFVVDHIGTSVQHSEQDRRVVSDIDLPMARVVHAGGRVRFEVQGWPAAIEMNVGLRSWKTLAAILTVNLVSSGLVLLRWPTDGTIDIVSQGANSVFRPLAFALTLAIMMLVPAFPATSFVTERKKGTLALLLNSPATASQIYFGKLTSNVILALILISASFPAMAACVAMGGISLRDHIAPLTIVLCTMAVQYSALGLWISLRSSSTDGSLRWTYAAILALAVLSIGPLILIGNLSGMLAGVAHWLTAVSPVSALQQIAGSQAEAATVGISTGWIDFMIASIVLTVVVAVVTIRKLDPLLLDRPRPTGKVIGKLGGEKAGLLHRMNYLVDPNKRKSSIPWWLNPVMVKEFRTRKFGRLHWLIRLVSICAIISLSLTVLASIGTIDWGVEKISGPLVLMQLSLMLLVGPSLGANLIAAEVESGGWQLLRATPFSPLRIVSGKVASVVWTMLLVLLATLPGYAVMSYIEPSMSGQIGNVIISLLVAVAMVVSISACVSSFCKSTAVATATSYGVLLLLFAGTLLVWLARGKPFGPVFVERVLLLNPAAAALSEMKTNGFEQYDLAPGSWWSGGMLSAICLVVLVGRTWRMTRPD